MVFKANGIAYGTKSGALIFDRANSAQISLATEKFSAPLPGNQLQLGELALWGTDNLLPQSMIRDIDDTSVLQATISAKARIAVGTGPMLAKVVSVDQNGNETLEFVNDPEVQDFLEANNAYMYSYSTVCDLIGLGNPFSQILLSDDRSKIIAFQRHDPSECRKSRKDPTTRKSENVLLSGDWMQFMNTGGAQLNDHTDTIPLLDQNYPLFDLQSRKDGHTFFIAMGYPLTGKQYYAPAPWYSARKWVKIAQGIPEMKAAMFNNQLTLKYVVDIHPQFWEKYDTGYKEYNPEKQTEIRESFYKDIDDLLVGGQNAYKSLFSTRVIDQETRTVVPGIIITPLDDKIRDGKLLPDSAAANSEILFALSMNPALTGVDTPGMGGIVQSSGSGSNIRESFLVQMMLLETERRINNTLFNVVKKYNGWPSEYVLRYPNKILTTLNTGANTQGVA